MRDELLSTPTKEPAAAATRPFEQPSLAASLVQLANTVVPYAAGWVLLYWSLHRSLWLSLVVLVVTAGLYVRLFVLFHDCVHSSFFRQRRANELVGRVLGVMTFTPYHWWRIDHLIHHNTSGDLDRRDISFGDIKLLTVEEYEAIPRWQRLLYHVFRHPLFLFGVAPLMLFFIRNRFVLRARPSAKERQSVVATNVALAVIAVLAWRFLDLADVLVTQLAILGTAASAGVWLFYVQHQFEGVYWRRHGSWSFADASLHGSSYYRLPRVLHWFTARIGFHHVHHLNPRIPNYRLEECHDALPVFAGVVPMTIRSSLKALHYRLWDEQHQVMLTWSGYRRRVRERMFSRGEGRTEADVAPAAGASTNR